MKHILKNTWAILEKDERKQFRLLVSLDIIISVLDILSLALLLWIIQFYVQPSASIRVRFLPSWLPDRNSVSFIAVFLLLFGIKNTAAFLISRAQYRFAGRVAIRISRDSLQRYQLAEFGEFVEVDSAVHIRRIGFQPFESCQYLLGGIQQIITQSSLIAFTIVAIILFDARLFLYLVLLLLPPVFVVFYFIRNRINASKKHIRINNEKSFQYLLDSLKGYVEGNVYHRNAFFLERFIKARKKFSQHLFESISIQSLPPRVIEMFAVIGLFILIVIAKWTGNDQHDALLRIGAFMAAAYKIIPGIVKIINASGQMRAYEFAANELPGKLAAIPIHETGFKPATIDSVGCKKISFHYKEHNVLTEFCLHINKGDFLGITGKSGKGKTTILNLLLGFLSPDEGRISVNGEVCDAAKLKLYWPGIAYVRQQSFFIHDTVLKNITLQEQDYDRQRLNCALKVSGLNELLEKSAEGLDKMIMENGKNISGGQQQRVALARALYKNADLLLLDEPFNELDESSATKLLEHFQSLAADGRMVIMITHDKHSLSYCNKIINLDEKD